VVDIAIVEKQVETGEAAPAQAGARPRRPQNGSAAPGGSAGADNAEPQPENPDGGSGAQGLDK